MTGTVDKDGSGYDGGYVRRRCEAVETAAAKMYQRGETVGTTKDMKGDKGDGV